ncbi:DUF3102 domain-containing protein [Desulfosporosinus youngiae]|uniref:Uncharacterized protein n=1 Tax=Desulfosporosinus youngiae DSM 17734 TaxID=768710 RepID=H5XWI8_9FIRM|nr:DUF3102 domain-containing protein [Desulfosporosinus youngiae]EHQ90496.1 Protein of unknown function (DUF3102) [Desulfosporosinus youngiae DSM 17734]
MAGRAGGFLREQGHNKLMRIFIEYGAGQLVSSNSDSNPNLRRQAVLLLGVPKEERAQFILDMDIETMKIKGNSH